MSMATDKAADIQERLRVINLELLEEYKGWNKQHCMKCIKCGFEFTSSPSTKLYGRYTAGRYSCAQCAKADKLVSQ